MKALIISFLILNFTNSDNFSRFFSDRPFCISASHIPLYIPLNQIRNSRAERWLTKRHQYSNYANKKIETEFSDRQEQKKIIFKRHLALAFWVKNEDSILPNAEIGFLKIHSGRQNVFFKNFVNFAVPIPYQQKNDTFKRSVISLLHSKWNFIVVKCELQDQTNLFQSSLKIDVNETRQVEINPDFGVLASFEDGGVLFGETNLFATVG